MYRRTRGNPPPLDNGNEIQSLDVNWRGLHKEQIAFEIYYKAQRLCTINSLSEQKRPKVRGISICIKIT